MNDILESLMRTARQDPQFLSLTVSKENGVQTLLLSFSTRSFAPTDGIRILFDPRLPDDVAIVKHSLKDIPPALSKDANRKAANPVKESTHKRWTKRDKTILENIFNQLTARPENINNTGGLRQHVFARVDKEAAKILERSVSSIAQQRARLNLTKGEFTRKRKANAASRMAAETNKKASV